MQNGQQLLKKHETSGNSENHRVKAEFADGNDYVSIDALVLGMSHPSAFGTSNSSLCTVWLSVLTCNVSQASCSNCPCETKNAGSMCLPQFTSSNALHLFLGVSKPCEYWLLPALSICKVLRWSSIVWQLSSMSIQMHGQETQTSVWCLSWFFMLQVLLPRV